MGRKRAKTDSYQIITDLIIEALENGTAPWVCPWDRAMGMPRNGHSGHIYRGINIMLLWASGQLDPRWYTYKQAGMHGESHVRSGEKGTRICYWKFLEKDSDRTDANGDPIKERVPMLRTFVVFNHTQVEWAEGCEPQQAVTPMGTVELDEQAMALFEAVPAKLTHGGTRAYYSQDVITLPPAASFATPGDYLATRAHELAHWTGHKDRLDRDMSGRFGDAAYAMEELVAELAAAFLCADLSLPGNLQHAEYIGSWVKTLKGDKFAVFTAARVAREAVEYIYDVAGTDAKTVQAATARATETGAPNEADRTAA